MRALVYPAGSKLRASTQPTQILYLIAPSYLLIPRIRDAKNDWLTSLKFADQIRWGLWILDESKIQNPKSKILPVMGKGSLADYARPSQAFACA
jgi:hypothetical protein